MEASFQGLMPRWVKELSARHFAHQLHNIALGIVEPHHPEVMGLHRSDQTWRRFDLHAQLDEAPVSGFDIGDSEIKDRARMIQFGTACRAKHKAHTAAVEERHVARREQKGQAKDIAIECRGAGRVVSDDRNLPDVRNSKTRHSGVSCSCAHGWLTSEEDLVSIANYIR